MLRIAIIPARGGSKRIPRKNIRPFCGRPMIAYAIHVALNSGLFDRVVVSTDDADIADVARTYGAEAPFMRSAALADDYASTAAVLVDALAQLGLNALETLKAVQLCCVYPATPLLRGEDLVGGLALLTQGSPQASVFAAGRFSHPVQRCFSRNEQGVMTMLWPENAGARTQDLAPRYYDAGQFYWLNGAAFFQDPQLLAGEVYGYLLPRHRSVDIDTLEDWEEVESIFQHQDYALPERSAGSLNCKIG